MPPNISDIKRKKMNLIFFKIMMSVIYIYIYWQLDIKSEILYRVLKATFEYGRFFLFIFNTF